MDKWARHIYQPGLPLGEDGRRITGSKEHLELARRAATEGMVLLKNNNVLPLSKGTKIATFGKATIDYVKGGGGSGDVTVAYLHTLYDGLKSKEDEGKISIYPELVKFYQDNVKEQYAAGYFPGMTKEPLIPATLLEGAAEFADVAIVSICRFSGEGWDRKASLEKVETLWPGELELAQMQLEVFPDSDFCLTAGEKKMIADVKSKFSKVVVVLNIGGIIETSWIKDDDAISSALLAWQGGIEGGDAAADLLVGDANPSGKLTDTFAKELEDYPSSYNFHDSTDYAKYTDDIYVGYRYFETIPGAADKVVYPFGYGLSYTTFDMKASPVKIIDDKVTIDVTVTNTGSVAGKEVIQLYYSAPKGLLGKPNRELLAFKKTAGLEVGESATYTLEAPASMMASYDDTGKIQKSAWLLESGEYTFFVGNNVRSATAVEGTYVVSENTIVEQLTSHLYPSDLEERLCFDGTMEAIPAGEEKRTHSILDHMPNKVTEGQSPIERLRPSFYLFEQPKISFRAVASGESTLDEFMATLTVEDLIYLLGGQPNKGVSNTCGIGNQMQYDIPNISTADGPAGLRILPQVGVTTTAWPCSTMLACTFDPEIATAIGNKVALEVKENNIGVWLAPAVNIHRSPLCGRNFEYYSEDPLVAGLMGCGMVAGVQSQNIGATVKHFAFNNKETNRKNSDSVVSERAAREIYLKPFEIIVKNSSPWCIMTAYNKVNGIHCSECYELLEDVLRGEWGFDGVVMTDWWTSGEHYLECKAGNDLKMASGYPDRIKEAYEAGEITKDELYKAAKNILKLILKCE
ncbi:MAG: glycoside hydrolase family 3 C-terminal domain-containing protein [Saccharofermentans sp.]|nr:glycoside hydrolase family 3 C-terminal domain-containing protein [Saccharofermentans sp.]